MTSIYKLLLSMTYKTVLSWYQVGMISKHEFKTYEELRKRRNGNETN
ncbi:MAG: hypothetical protein ACOC1K_01255 [Nanoarchaeota archaeon]